MVRTALTVAFALGLWLPATGGQAQETNTDVPQAFWVEIGGFRVSSDTNLILNGSRPGDDVDFERDFDIPTNTTQAYMEVFYRPWNRHQFSLNWTRVQRDGPQVILEDDIEWGDSTFPVGVQVSASNDTDFLSGAYRWSVYKNDTFEIGPALGIGYIWIDASLTGQVAVGDEVSEVRTVTGSATSITGDIGGFFYWWPGRRWMARGDLRYIAVGFDTGDASVTEGRASVTWYPWRQFGIGVQYSYTRLEYARDVIITELGGAIQYDGLQIMASVAF